MLSVSLTEKAAEKVKTFMAKESKPALGLRVFVKDGGCSGFSYGMTFDDKTGDGDNIVESNGVKLLVDQESASYLEGARIDYVESVMGEGFMVENPNAESTCGCGHSFKPKH